MPFAGEDEKNAASKDGTSKDDKEKKSKSSDESSSESSDSDLDDQIGNSALFMQVRVFTGFDWKVVGRFNSLFC